ncbi:MAG: ABC transporter ATP-binding protein, partial [Pseudomonadota bacterium]
AQETEVLLLDEPTTFLDLKVQVDVMTLLCRAAREKGRTLVVVLHELNVAAAFADRLVMMQGGAIAAQGPVEEVFTSANLSAVFGLDATVLTDPESGRPVCVPRIAGAGGLASAAQ